MAETIFQLIVPLIMFVLMFGMGLTLTIDDFKRIGQYPKPVLIGLFLQLIIIPIAGILIAVWFNLSTMLAVGLIALAACPGGSTSNVVVHLGKGDTALSITLTAIATFVTLISLPLWVKFSLTFLGGVERQIDMPVIKTAIQLGGFTVFPVALGMIARIKLPSLIAKEPIISKSAAVAMITVLIASSFVDSDNMLANSGAVVLPTVSLLLVSVIIGYGIPRIFSVNIKQSSTIAVETAMKNMLLSMFIAMNALKKIDAIYASVVYLPITLPVAIVVMVMYRRSEKKELKAEAAG